MTDVFISYASEDRNEAQKLNKALEVLGWSVFWDRKIIVGQEFDAVIERQLETAKTVVVLWSKASVVSEWVKNEAAVAAERGVLIPAMIEQVKLPLEFRRKQTADLIDWDGDPSDSGFVSLRDGISAIAGDALNHSEVPPPGRKVRSKHFWTWITLSVLVAALVAGVFLWINGSSTTKNEECREITVWDYSKSPPESHKEKRCD